MVPKKSSPGKVAYIRHFQWIIWNKHDEVWKTLIHFKSDVFIVVAVVDAKTPYLIKPAVAGTQATLGFKSHKIGKQAVREDKPKTNGSILIIDWSFFLPLPIPCLRCRCSKPWFIRRVHGPAAMQASATHPPLCPFALCLSYWSHFLLFSVFFSAFKI